MIDTEDLSLVERCRNGDRAAFERLIEKYQKAIYNLALRMVRQDAEDVTQTTFLKAFESIETYKPGYKFFSWLYRIAYNECLDLLDERKRTQTLEEAESVPQSEDQDGVEARDESGKIEEALMELKIEHRAVVLLKHFEGLSYEEIGQILDISEKKVKSRLFTARQILRDILVQKGLGNVD
jgi:RNA polymerase sigma-70 factor (ECF subfamily)